MITKHDGDHYYNTEAMQNIVTARSLLAKAARLLRRTGEISVIELDRRMASLEQGHGEDAKGAKVGETVALLLGELRVAHRAAKNAGDDLNKSFAPMVKSWMGVETDPAAVNYVHKFLFDWDLEDAEKDTKKDIREDTEENVP